MSGVHKKVNVKSAEIMSLTDGPDGMVDLRPAEKYVQNADPVKVIVKPDDIMSLADGPDGMVDLRPAEKYIQKVDPDNIEKALFPDGGSDNVNTNVQLHPTEANLWQAVKGLLGLLGVVIFIAACHLWLFMPPLSMLPLRALAATDPQQCHAAMDLYKQVADVGLNSTERFFDMVVYKVLFPLLTAIIGYFIGTRKP